MAEWPGNHAVRASVTEFFPYLLESIPLLSGAPQRLNTLTAFDAAPAAAAHARR